MKADLLIEPIKFKTLTHLPNSWSQKDYINLLEIMDYGDTVGMSDQEIKEMCLLSLSDNEPEDAAEIVLKYVFKEELNSGQIQNLSHEIQNEKLWEEYADLSTHEQFFNVGQLLYDAYNGKFPHPEATQFGITVTTKNKEDFDSFDTNAEGILIRILVQGMPENTLLKRLFKDELEFGNFKQAKDIIWQLKIENQEENTLTFEIISSLYWFQDFKYAKPFEAKITAMEIKK